MAKGRKLNDLRNIHQLFTPGEKEKPFAEQLAAQAAAESQPQFGEIEVEILALMRNYRGWTVGDVQRCLIKHPDADTIPAIMNRFANEGKFDIMTIAGRPNTYSLKRTPVETITSARNKAVPFKLQDPIGTRKAPDPKGVILLEEGLDVAIWKIMSDGKMRNKNEICAMLAEYKFDRVQANRRVDAMINSRNYFDRRDGGSGGMRYAMKKHVPMPKPLNQVVMEEQNALTKIRENLTAPLTVETSGNQGSFAPRHSASRDTGSVFSIVSDALKADEHIEKVDGAALVAQENAEAELLAAANRAPLEPLNPVIDLSSTMAEDDHLVTLIWKAMSDRKGYKSEDVAVLVQTVRPSQSLKSIQNKLSALGIEGWFDVQRVGNANVYTLKQGIPMPELKVNSLRDAQREAFKEMVQAGAAKQQELPVETPQQAFAKGADEFLANAAAEVAAQSSTENKETEMTKATQAGSAAAPATSSLVKVKANAPYTSPVALLDTNIRIKGVEFTLLEADQLADELTALGYADNKVRSLTLVNQTVEIKGVEFTMRELCELTDGLLKAGFGKDNVRVAQ